MTKYFTNFEDIPFIQNGIGGLAFPEARIGNYPSIWTRRGSNVSPGYADGKVFNSSSAVFKRRICSFQNNQQQNVAFSLVAIDTDKGRGDVDIVLSVNPQASVSRTQVFVRGQGTTSITDGYIFSIEHAANRVRIYKVQGGVQTNPFPDRSITHSAGTTRVYRFRVSGSNPTTLYVKTWKDEVPEPTTWGLEVTDGGSPENTLTAAGWVGVGVYPTTHGVLGESYINYLGIATGGQTAALPVSNQDFVTWLSLANERRVLFEGSVTGYDGVSAAVSRPVYIANGGYTSHEQDSPSLQNYRPAIAKVPTFRREISLALSGRVTTGIGSLVLNNNASEALAIPSLSVALRTSVVPEVGPNPTSFSRALTAYVKDLEGLLKVANSGEVRFEGARRVENLLTNSEDFSNAFWVTDAGGTGVVPSKTPNFALAPDGSYTACRVQMASGPSGYSRIYNQTVTWWANSGLQSVWMKTTDGSTKSVTLGDLIGSNRKVVSVDGTWKRFANSPGTGGAGTGFEVYSENSPGLTDLLIWHPQVEDVKGQTNQNVSEYVSSGVLSSPYHGAFVDGVKYFDYENQNTVTANVVTEKKGGPLSWVNFPGVANNYLSRSAPTLTPNGDLDLRICAAAPWSYGDYVVLSSVWPTGNGSFQFGIDAGSGKLFFNWRTSGGVDSGLKLSTVTLSSLFANGVRVWLRVTLDVDNGAGGNTVRFYYSTDRGSTWTQLGADVTTAGTTNVQALTGKSWVLGAQQDTGGYTAIHRIYSAEIRDGIGGSIAASFLTVAGDSSAWSLGTYVSYTHAFTASSTLGYRKERAGTNLCIRSQEFDNAAWIKIQATISANSSSAPDGTTTADTLLDNAVNAIHAASGTSFAITANSTICASVYAKPVGRNIAIVVYNGGNYFRQVFDLTAGAAGSSDVGGAGTLSNAIVERLPDGFFRCSVIGAVNAGAVGAVLEVDLASGTTIASLTYAGTGSLGAIIWGAQAEQASYPSSYVPTAGVAVTRPEDRLTYPIGVFPDATGTISAEYQPDSWSLANGSSQRIIGHSSDYATVLSLGSTPDVGGVATSDSTIEVLGPSSTVASGFVRGTAVWSGTEMQAFSNGVGGSVGAFDGSHNLSALGVGYTTVVSDPLGFQGVIRGLQIFRRRLTGPEINRLPASPLGVPLDAAPIPERDDWLRMKWARSYGKMLLGDPSWPRHDFRVVLYGRPSQPTAPNPQQIQMEMKDLLGLLEVPLRTSRYSSSDPLSGQLKPMTYNSPYYMEPVPTNVAGTEHQISDSALTTAPEDVTDDGVSLTTTLTMGAVDTGADTISFRQAGSPTVVVNHGLLTDARVRWASGAPAPLSNGTDYYVVNPTATTIQVAATRGGAATNLTSAGTDGATVTARSWWEDLTNGKITVTASPAGRIMVKKPNATASVLEAGYLYQQIVFPQAISSAIDPTTHFNLSIEHYDQQSFTDLLNAVTQATGIVFYSEDVSALAAIDQVSKGTQTWYGFTPDGLFQVGRISLPSSTSVLDLLESDVKQDSLRLSSVLLPVDRTSLEVRYSKNYYLNGRLNLAPSKIQDLLRDYAAATGTAWSGGTVPLDDHPESAELQDFAPFDTLFSTNGSSEVTRLQTLYKKLLGVFTFQTRISALYRSTGLPICIGDTISLTHSRYGWKSYAAGETSLDATAAFDGTKAVLLGYDVNFSSDDPFPVRMTVFRQIPGYYPTANP